MASIRIIPKRQWIMLYIGVPVVYGILFKSLSHPENFTHAWFQSNQVQLVIQAAYLTILYRFDFHNNMIMSRFSSMQSFYKRAWMLMGKLACAYLLLVIPMIVIGGMLLGEAVSWQKALIFSVYTLCNALILAIVYIIVCYRWGKWIARVLMCGIVFCCFALCFGEFIPLINIFTFCMESQVSLFLLLRSVCVYGALLGVLYFLADPGRKER